MAFAVLWLPLPSLTPQPDITIFGLTWHEIASTFHFLAVLCLYDGGLTFTEVNHSALLAEMTSSPSERAECNMWSAVCAGCGALTSWIAYVTWDPVDLTHFRASTLCVAGLAWIVFETSGRITARFIVGGPVSTATAVVEDDSGAVIEDEAERRPVSPRDRKSSVSKSVTQSPSRDSDVGQSFIGFLLQVGASSIDVSCPSQHLSPFAAAAPSQLLCVCGDVIAASV